MSMVSPHHIDLAFAAAATVVGVDPHAIAEDGILLELHQGPIIWESQAYAGATEETVSRIAWYPCAFDPKSAMVHEFVHATLFASRGDTDPGHTDPLWTHTDAARSALQPLCNRQG